MSNTKQYNRPSRAQSFMLAGAITTILDSHENGTLSVQDVRERLLPMLGTKEFDSMRDFPLALVRNMLRDMGALERTTHKDRAAPGTGSKAQLAKRVEVLEQHVAKLERRLAYLESSLGTHAPEQGELPTS